MNAIAKINHIQYNYEKLLLAALVVLMGLAFGPIFELSMRAANDMLEPQRYIEAVLGAVIVEKP
jgi:formate hydrogenlyase subunit 3/multisubunit Na+/H+ antiporter MnhD subunit